MIKSGKMRWLGHAACMVHVRNASKVILRIPEGKIPLGFSVHGGILLKLISKGYDVKVCIGCIWFGIEYSDRHL